MSHKVCLLISEAKELFLQLDKLELDSHSKQSLCADLLTDLGALSNHISKLDGKLTEDERLVMSVFLRYPLLQDHDIDFILSWNLLDPEEKQLLFKSVDRALEAAPKQMPQNFICLERFIEISNQKFKSEIAQKFASHLFRFAILLIKPPAKILSKNEINLIEDLRHKILLQIKNNSKFGRQQNICAQNISELEQELFKLDSLIGLEQVKEEVRSLINLLKLQKARRKSGLKVPELSLHAVFCGPPGTGKTTVARIYAKILKSMGLLSEGNLVETDRAGMVAEYVGQTAAKVNKLVDQAKGGVLFIDEAYSLLTENGQSDYGKEAIEVLLKRMEDLREDLVVIVAGYPQQMQDFLQANPGLKSRFARRIEFKNYNPDQLRQIFIKFASENDYRLSEEAIIKLEHVCNQMILEADNSFGNARAVRNLFEQSLLNQANRLAIEKDLDKNILETLESSDIKADER